MSDSLLPELATPARIHLPLLTANAKEIFGLSAEARKNANLLELLALRDPVASAKLLAAGNPEVSPRALASFRVRDAITSIGTAAAYEILRSSALLASSLEWVSGADIELVHFARKYMLSLSATVAQMRRRSRIPTTAALETCSGFTGLGLAMLLMQKPPDAKAIDKLRKCAANGDFKLHAHVELRTWLRSSSIILNSWGTQKVLVTLVNKLHHEICDVYDGKLSTSHCLQETAVVVSAQWLLSETSDEDSLTYLWNELSAAQRSGLTETGFMADEFKVTVC